MSKILKPADLNTHPAKNDKGEWATYEQGEFMGYQPMLTIVSLGIALLAPVFVKPLLDQMVADAKADGIKLTIAKCFVTLQAQIDIRKAYLKKDLKAKVNDLAYILSAPVTDFNPVVGLPGWSNHQNVKFPAVDFNVTGFPAVYAWLVKNAHKYGFIRTVASERWHWEYRPKELDMFAKVEKTHATWDNLVTK